MNRNILVLTEIICHTSSIGIYSRNQEIPPDNSAKLNPGSIITFGEIERKYNVLAMTSS